MTDPDTPSVPALPDRARPFRWLYFSARLGMVAALLGLAAVIPGGHGARFAHSLGPQSTSRVKPATCQTRHWRASKWSSRPSRTGLRAPAA